jgi:hypothetical protein
MEKHVVTWSYWLGLGSTLIALLLRTLNAFGLLVAQVVKQGQTIWYMSFYKGALLFFLIAVATASYTWTRSQKLQ